MANVARQPNRMIGREAERADLEALLASDCRLVTITGPGGIGKTRLALDVAAGSDRTAVVVELAAIADPELFLPTVAGALAIATLIGGDVRPEIEQALRTRRVLLVLDNLEHLPGVAKEVAWLIGLDADLRVLATSRSPLQIRGEHEFALQPLDSSGGAVDLFIERAQEANRAFVVDDAARAVITRICERLDGLPLAIELAAARMKVVSPAVLESMLDQRLALLTGGEQDRPSRHRTMRDAIAWSYDLLSPSQQNLFARISLFEGSFSLREATRLAGDGEEPAATFRALDGLTGLIDASLALRAEGTASRGSGCWGPCASLDRRNWTSETMRTLSGGYTRRRSSIWLKHRGRRCGVRSGRSGLIGWKRPRGICVRPCTGSLAAARPKRHCGWRHRSGSSGGGGRTSLRVARNSNGSWPCRRRSDIRCCWRGA